jgi:hypothetical protein
MTQAGYNLVPKYLPASRQVLLLLPLLVVRMLLLLPTAALS